MSAAILVAPREIVDLVYRASRVTGLDSGVASSIGRSACFSCGQLGSQLDNIAEPLASRTSPAHGFAPVALVEVEAIRSGSADLELETRFTVADLAYSAMRAGRRATSISMECSDGTLHAPHEWLSVGRARLEIVRLVATTATAEASVLDRVQSRHVKALREGISISSRHWHTVSEVARQYLVEESVIDAAESSPPV